VDQATVPSDMFVLDNMNQIPGTVAWLVIYRVVRTSEKRAYDKRNEINFCKNLNILSLTTTLDTVYFEKKETILL
jgi:hypothetical protein